MKDKLQELMGYVQDGSNIVITIFQDDVSPYGYHIKGSESGKTLWSDSGTTLEDAINNAYYHVIEVKV